METPDMSSMHAFQSTPLQMPQMASYTSTPQFSQAQESQSESTDRARVYKSRNKRPCDFCRYKKAACHLDSQPPCELCIRYKKECTFVESPAKRRRPNENSEGSQSRKSTIDNNYNRERNGHVSHGVPFNNGHIAGNMEIHPSLMAWENGMQSFHMTMGMDGPMAEPDFPLDPAFYNEPGMGFDAFEPMSATSTLNPMESNIPSLHDRSSVDTMTSPHSASSQMPFGMNLPFDATSGESSLDLQSSSNAQIIGPSGESDPYLLSRYRYDHYNEAAFQSVRIRKMSTVPGLDKTIPTFFAIQHNALTAKAQPLERAETMERHRRDVEDMVSDEVGRRLIRLFYKMDALFRIAWLSVQPLFHTPCLAAVQTLLLLVQRRPTNKHVSDTPFKGFIMSAAISLAHSLGLNRDPSDWALPSWEVKLRRRLAWALYIQDKWLALNSGRPSQIHADDWDVLPLQEEDFIESDRKSDIFDPTATMSRQHFISLVELTRIVDDILRVLFSIKATRALHNSLECTLEVAKPLRLRLTEWYQNLSIELRRQTNLPSVDGNRRPSQLHDLDGNGSLYLAFITAKIELFRAMLRPQITNSTATAVTALRTGAMAVAREVIEFLDGLEARELEAFWASYARTNFTIASSFMLLLYVTSPNVVDAKECLTLLNAWRSILRIKSRSSDLLNLALLRLDGVYVAGMDRLIELSPAAAQAWNENSQAMV